MGVEIFEHVKDLRKIAAKCDVCAEFGVQHAPEDGSTFALLEGTRKALHSVEIKPLGDYLHVQKRAQSLGKDWVFYPEDSRTVNLPPVDFLFIDSEHNPDIVREELDRHAKNVKKFIGFHDTYPCQYGSFPEYAAAVREWMEEHDDSWELHLDKENCCGLSIYRRIN